MKLIQQEETFRPVTIVIETEKELAELYVVLNEYVNNNNTYKGIDIALCNKLYTSKIMSNSRAKKILSK